MSAGRFGANWWNWLADAAARVHGRPKCLSLYWSITEEPTEPPHRFNTSCSVSRKRCPYISAHFKKLCTKVYWQFFRGHDVATIAVCLMFVVKATCRVWGVIGRYVLVVDTWWLNALTVLSLSPRTDRVVRFLSVDLKCGVFLISWRCFFVDRVWLHWLRCLW